MSLSVSDTVGNAKSVSGDSGIERIDFLVKAGSVSTISVTSSGSPPTFDLQFFDLIDLVPQTGGNALVISGVPENEAITVGPGPLTIGFSGSTNVAYSSDILDDPTLFGSAPITAVHIQDLFPENSVIVVPGMTLPVTMESAAPDATATTVAGQPVTIEVLPNDGDTSHLVSAVTKPGARQRHRINPNSTITYTPAAGFTGTDTFQYTAADSAGVIGMGMVTVTVTRAGQSRCCPPVV